MMRRGRRGEAEPREGEWQSHQWRAGKKGGEGRSGGVGTRMALVSPLGADLQEQEEPLHCVGSSLRGCLFSSKEY
jgi:hypothetical protein